MAADAVSLYLASIESKQLGLDVLFCNFELRGAHCLQLSAGLDAEREVQLFGAEHPTCGEDEQIDCRDLALRQSTSEVVILFDSFGGELQQFAVRVAPFVDGGHLERSLLNS